MMVSKAKAPSWPASLPGWERSANMEYAEWALVGTLPVPALGVGILLLRPEDGQLARASHP